VSPWALWNSLHCEDVAQLIVRATLQVNATVYPLLRDLSRYVDTCAYWPTEPDSALDREIKVTSVPALILTGGMSSFYGPAYADAAARAFDDPAVLVFPSLGNGVLSSDNACISDVRMRFLRAPEAEVDAQDCIASVPPIKFEGT
jgi:hypothetical protein